MLPTASRAGIMLLGHSYISSLNISSLVYWQYQSLTCQSWFRCLSFLTEMAVGGHWVGLSLATVRRLFYTVCACKDGWSYTWAMSAQLVLSNTLSCIIKDFDRRAGIYASFFFTFASMPPFAVRNSLPSVLSRICLCFVWLPVASDMSLDWYAPEVLQAASDIPIATAVH